MTSYYYVILFFQKVLKISFLHLPVTYFVKEVKVLLLAVFLDRIIELTTHPVSII